MLIGKGAWHQQNSKFFRIYKNKMKWKQCGQMRKNKNLLYNKYKDRSNKDKFIRQHQM